MMTKRVYLTILFVVCLGTFFSACLNNTKKGEDMQKNNQTVQIEPTSTLTPITPTDPTSTLTVAECKETSSKIDIYQGLDSRLDGFTLDSYNCVYVGKRSVVWALKTEAPEKYIAEGQKIDQGIEKLEAYLNTSLSIYYAGAEKVTFFYGGTSTAFVPGGRPVVFMPPASDPYSFHNYMHEMTHLLTPQHGDWVSEGLAVYLNDKLGGGGGFPNFGDDIDQLALSYLDRTDIIEKVGDESYYPSWADLRTSVGSGFYILSGSFVKYMIENIGIEAFMQAYKAPNMQEGLNETTQKTLQAWKDEWLSSLASMKK